MSGLLESEAMVFITMKGGFTLIEVMIIANNVQFWLR